MEVKILIGAYELTVAEAKSLYATLGELFSPFPQFDDEELEEMEDEEVKEEEESEL